MLCFALVNIARQQSPTQGSEAIWNLEAAVDVALALLSGSIPQIVGAQVQLILSGALLFLGMLKKDAALLEEALETSIAVWLLLSGLGHPLANRAKPITATAVRTLTEILQPAEYQGIFRQTRGGLTAYENCPRKAPGNVAVLARHTTSVLFPELRTAIEGRKSKMLTGNEMKSILTDVVYAYRKRN